MKKTLAFLLTIFVTQSVFAEVACNVDLSKYYARYRANTYTCQNGQYLPANTLGCVTCPTGFTCPGGTFEFNPDRFQGISLIAIHGSTMNNICAKNAPNIMSAIFTPNTHTCSAGYYLPANVDECTLCPADNICSGGTYTFNETIDQGIVACTAPTPYAPTGSAVCYPHILHVDDGLVYLRSTKLTSPSLHIRIEDDVFYANMTTIPTRMNKDSVRYFHSQWDDNHYYICDDTTYPGE